MTEKKSHTSQEEESGIVRWIESVKEHLVKHAGNVVAGLLESIEEGVAAIVRKTMHSLSLFFFVLLGATFLLVGVAQMLDQVYQFPGVGKIIIGVVIFSIVLLLSMIERRYHQ